MPNYYFVEFKDKRILNLYKKKPTYQNSFNTYPIQQIKLKKRKVDEPYITVQFRKRKTSNNLQFGSWHDFLSQYYSLYGLFSHSFLTPKQSLSILS